ncbi:putative outer membrane protein assembly factor [subsurface metagenome]
MDLVINVEESSTANINFGIMFSGGDEDNAVPDPYTGYLVDGITDYEYASRNVPYQYMMDYKTWKISVGLNTGYRYFTLLGWLGVRSGLSTTLEKITYDDTLYRPFDPEIRAGLERWSFINKLGITIFWDKRDYFLNPTNGFYIAQGVTFAGGFLFGQREYIRTDSTVEGFLTLFDLRVTDKWSFKMVLAAHSSLSFIFPQFGQKEPITVPTDLLYVDGMIIARGWPLERDKKALWDNRLELRLPIAERFLWWVFFLDGVAAYDEIDLMTPLKLADFYFSLGGGIRFTIPQFPIRLYLAQRFRFNEAKRGFERLEEEGALPLFGLSLNFVISLGGDMF